MQKYKGKSFEEQMRDSLEGAEMNPPEGIWTAIDGEIANVEASSLRRQVVFYRAIVATLLIIIVSSLLIGLQYGDFNNSNDLVDDTNVKSTLNVADADHPVLQRPYFPSNDEFLKLNVIVENSSNNKGSNRKSNISEGNNQSNEQVISGDRSSGGANNVSITFNRRNTIVTLSDNQTEVNSAINKSGRVISSDFPHSYEVVNEELISGLIENRKFLGENDALVVINPVEISKNVYYQKIPTYDFVPEHLVADNANRNAKSWADFNVRGGLFEPNYQIESVESVATPATGFRFASLGTDNFPNNRNEVFTNNTDFRGEDLTAGYSYTMNISYGKRITNRLFMVSGLEYGIYESVASTNRVLTDGAEKRVAVTEQIIADGNIDFQNDNLGLGFENVELNNSFRFASIPVRVGYKLFDKKVSVSVTSGISTGFYLGNKIQDPDRVLDEKSFSRRNNSIYREINFSAVGGISIGYNLFDNFLFTIEPVYQRALNSYTRNNSDFSALPENFGVSAGIRVLFK